jgi:hypothetical protein
VLSVGCGGSSARVSDVRQPAEATVTLVVDGMV